MTQHLRMSRKERWRLQETFQQAGPPGNSGDTYTAIAKQHRLGRQTVARLYNNAPPIDAPYITPASSLLLTIYARYDRHLRYRQNTARTALEKVRKELSYKPVIQTEPEFELGHKKSALHAQLDDQPDKKTCPLLAHELSALNLDFLLRLRPIIVEICSGVFLHERFVSANRPLFVEAMRLWGDLPPRKILKNIRGVLNYTCGPAVAGYVETINPATMRWWKHQLKNDL